MEALKCDVCGGKLVMNAGGKEATCEYCGMTYSLERVREKVQEIKGTVSISGTVQARQTGTEEDVQQWKQLLRKYMNDCDYRSAFSIAKKILEAVPSDEETNNLYNSLKELQYFDIRNGVLAKYNGREKCVKVPEGVKTIGKGAFNGVDIEKIILPDSVERISRYAFGFSQMYGNSKSHIKSIKFGNGLKVIEKFAFSGCDYLKLLELPNTVEEIGPAALPENLEHLIMPQSYRGTAVGLFNCYKLSVIDASLEFIENAIKLYDGGYDDDLYDREVIDATCWKFWDCPWAKRIQSERWRNSNRCQYCGGLFKGVLSKTCSKCGRQKDY